MSEKTYTLVLDHQNLRSLHLACGHRVEYLKTKLAEAERKATARPDTDIAEINFELEISRTLCAHLLKLEPDAA